MTQRAFLFFFFFFNDTATTEIYTLSLHDALPIYITAKNLTISGAVANNKQYDSNTSATVSFRDRKSTRLNSSHLVISYAVFCLKKKNYGAVHLPGCSGLETHLLADQRMQSIPPPD